MSDWHEHLESIRSRELSIALGQCPDKLFPEALELGAGDGFQSRRLIRYASHLVATDLNVERLQRTVVPGVEYRIGDAERVGESFPESSFDLVWASNLFEHLPDPARALLGIRRVLKPDGIVILIMPNALWKTLSLLGFYPNAARLALRAFASGRIRTLWKRYVTGTADVEKITGNNLKAEHASSPRAGVLWPLPHGAYASHVAEFSQYRKKRWLREFDRAGFRTISVRKGPVASGYGFNFDTMRAAAEYLGFTTEFIYVLAPKGSVSSYERFFEIQRG